MDAWKLAGTADHPALGLLNTRFRSHGEPLELIDGGDGLLRWCGSADLLGGPECADVVARLTSAQLDDAAAQVRDLREWVRSAVDDWAGSKDHRPVPAAVATLLNQVLAHEDRYTELVEVRTQAGSRLDLVARHRLEGPRALLAVVARPVADLFAHGDPQLVRRCDGSRCTLWFYDRTRTHRRRWCSMAVCGNRAKQRAHRDRVHGPADPAG